jgi:hypothetical protein
MVQGVFSFKQKQVWQALKALLPGISPSFLLTHLLLAPPKWSVPAETGADRLVGVVSEKEEDAWAGKKAELTARTVVP